MSKKSNLIFYTSLILNLSLNITSIYLGYVLAGTIMLFSTVIIYTTCYVWITQWQEAKFNIKNKILLLPIGIIFIFAIHHWSSNFFTQSTGEDALQAVGQMMLARYQAAMWIVGVVFATILIVAASAVSKGRQE